MNNLHLKVPAASSTTSKHKHTISSASFTVTEIFPSENGFPTSASEEEELFDAFNGNEVPDKSLNLMLDAETQSVSTGNSFKSTIEFQKACDSCDVEKINLLTQLVDNPSKLPPAAELKSPAPRDKESQAPAGVRQGRLLLVSLLESFCALYGNSPDHNRRLFLELCRQLMNLGVIEEQDFIEELGAIRSSYTHAFKELVMHTISELHSDSSHENGDRSRLAMKAKNPDEYTDSTGMSTGRSLSNHISKLQSVVPFRNRMLSTVAPPPTPLSSQDHLFSSQNLISQFKVFNDILNLQKSRFYEDFVQVQLLGRGAFGSVHQVWHKLDGVDYAVKKIIIKANRRFEVDKILREVKMQARLAHPHVVRYYSAWLEQEKPSESTAKTEEKPMSKSFYAIGNDHDSEIMSGDSHAIDRARKSFDVSIGNSDCLPTANEPFNDDFSPFSMDDLDELPNRSYASSMGLNIKFSESDTEPSRTNDSDISSTASESIHELSGQVALQRSVRMPMVTETGHVGPTVKIPQLGSDLALFIQMELCSFTLQDWMNIRNAAIFESRSSKEGLMISKNITNRSNVDVDKSDCLKILRDVCEGLVYLHSQGIIHRDIKPSNIYWKPEFPLSFSSAKDTTGVSYDSPKAPSLGTSFGSRSSIDRHSFSDFNTDKWRSKPAIERFRSLQDWMTSNGVNGKWKIGDFGLVTSEAEIPLGQHNAGGGSNNNSLPLYSPTSATTAVNTPFKSSTETKSESTERTAGVGTITYASPEQLDPSLDYEYTTKTDMYSVGVLLLELLHPCETLMERAEVLGLARSKLTLPESIAKGWHKESVTIMCLMSPNPASRPSAQELLESGLLNDDHLPLSSVSFEDLDTVQVKTPKTSLEMRRDTGAKEQQPRGVMKVLMKIRTSAKRWFYENPCHEHRLFQKDEEFTSLRAIELEKEVELKNRENEELKARLIELQGKLNALGK